MIDTEQLTERIFNLTGIKTRVFAKHVDLSSATIVSCEERSTDAIRLDISKKRFLVEVYPAEMLDEEIAIYVHDTLEQACAMFEALHFYRDKAIKPFIQHLNEMT